MFRQELRQLVDLAGRTGFKLCPTRIEQHVAQGQYHSTRSRRRLQRVEFRLNPRRFLGRLVALVQRHVGHRSGVISGLFGVFRFARARGEHDLIAFDLSCGHPCIIRLGGGVRLRQPRVLRGQIGGLIHVGVLVMQRRVLRDAQVLSRPVQIQRCVLVDVRVGFGGMHRRARGFQRCIRLRHRGAGAQGQRQPHACEYSCVHDCHPLDLII